MKIQIAVLTDRGEETGRKFEIPDLSWYIAETVFDKLLCTLTKRNKPTSRSLQAGDLYKISDMPHDEATVYIRENAGDIHDLMILVSNNIVNGWMERYKREVDDRQTQI